MSEGSLCKNERVAIHQSDEFNHDNCEEIRGILNRMEIPFDEQRDWTPANLILLEPGKVMMAAEAKETIRKLKKAGVEVIEVPIKEWLSMGGGMYCWSLSLIRDRGPKLEDIK